MLASRVIASAPTRIDFGGGWTDVPPWPQEQGGFVCNLAIEKRATVVLSPASSSGSSHTHTHTKTHDDSHAGTIAGERSLALAALNKAGLKNTTVAIQSDFPVGAGLGGSSAAGVALAAAIAHVQNRSIEPAALALWSRDLEVSELGIVGGFQDHYAAAFGGALAITFEEQHQVRSIPLSQAVIDELERSLTLVYSGQSRISGKTITAVLDSYRSRQHSTVRALKRMAELARTMSTALASGDIVQLAALVDEQWIHQRSLHPKISTERIDAIEQVTRKAGAMGFKALGASGGGCVVIFSPPERTPQVQAAAELHGKVIPWSVAREGVRVHH